MKRNRSLQLILVLGIVWASCNTGKDRGNVAPNVLTDAEKAEGWELLFDGESLTGWKEYGKDSISKIWGVKDDAIHCDPKSVPDSVSKNSGSLMTINQYGDFELKFEWKISSGGNSGVLYHVVEKPEYKKDYETGPEYQVLDDLGWKGEVLKPAQFCGSNYDMYAADSTKKLQPAGQWNQGRIIYSHGHVEHWLNDKLVVSFNESDPEFQERYSKSKWVNYPDWNKYKTGSITLQEHEDVVDFRNIKIRPLK